MALLALDGITKMWPDAGIVGISLEVDAGETLYLIGRNGAGKTTMLELIMGHLRPDAGSIRIDGRDVTGWSAAQRAGIVAQIAQDPSRLLVLELSILENLLLAEEAAGQPMPWFFPRMRSRASVRARLDQWGLSLRDRLDDRVEVLSGGERQILSLIMVLMRAPKVLLLDEPTNALDVALQPAFDEAVGKILKSTRPAAIIVTHRLKDALRGDRIAVLRGGGIVADLRPGDPRWSLEGLHATLLA